MGRARKLRDTIHLGKLKMALYPRVEGAVPSPVLPPFYNHKYCSLVGANGRSGMDHSSLWLLLNWSLIFTLDTGAHSLSLLAFVVRRFSPSWEMSAWCWLCVLQVELSIPLTLNNSHTDSLTLDSFPKARRGWSNRNRIGWAGRVVSGILKEMFVSLGLPGGGWNAAQMLYSL